MKRRQITDQHRYVEIQRLKIHQQAQFIRLLESQCADGGTIRMEKQTLKVMMKALQEALKELRKWEEAQINRDRPTQ